VRSPDSGDPRRGVDLDWLPLGVRGRWLRIAGRVYETISAWQSHRTPLDLYHSVLELRTGAGRFVIEMGPAIDDDGDRRGVVGVGSVGASWAGAIRPFRYEVRCWPDGITAAAFAVDGPRHLTDDVEVAELMLEIVHAVPTPVWGRDELAVGEVWTCNSLTSWLLAQVGLEGSTRPPADGRAPGWNAGVRLAHQQQRLVRVRLLSRVPADAHADAGDQVRSTIAASPFPIEHARERVRHLQEESRAGVHSAPWKRTRRADAFAGFAAEMVAFLLTPHVEDRVLPFNQIARTATRHQGWRRRGRRRATCSRRLRSPAEKCSRIGNATHRPVPVSSP
jgi:hypothetical protein